MANSTPPQQQHSAVHTVLAARRKQVWSTHLPAVLNPIRSFFIDPWLQFWSISLPPLALYLRVDSGLSKVISFTLAPLGWFLYLFPSDEGGVDGNTARSAAKTDLLHSRQPSFHFQPPSDFVSAIEGGFAFLFSVTTDLIGAFMNPEKMRKWWEALAAFRTYLHASGVGAELEEAMIKPLWRGRLLANMKILNDVQETQDADRGTSIHDSSIDVSTELSEGCRMMRFATAAYGKGMIKSAVDREATQQDIEDDIKAIAFHTNVKHDDIIYYHTEEGGNMKVLRHYIAVDSKSESIVLAIRGTLSISGALVDMQAMDCDYCGGRAHKGIAEQAEHIWQESGSRVQEALDKYPNYSLAITGHSLGAGAACLLQVKIYCESLLPGQTVECFGFAPPPTYSPSPEPSHAILEAMHNSVCYIHDNDCVPLLSVSSIRRLADLMDAVDNRTEHMWFWRRFRLFWEWEPIPQDLIDEVANLSHDKECTIGECEMMIPARVVVWMKKNFAGTFESFACKPKEVAKLNIFMCEDMVTDHLPEQYEDALDILTEKVEG